MRATNKWQWSLSKSRRALIQLNTHISMILISIHASVIHCEPIYRSRARRGIWVVSGRYFAQVLDRHASVAGTLGHRIATTQSSSLKELLAETWQIPEADQRAVATLFLCCFGVIEKGLHSLRSLSPLTGAGQAYGE